MEKIILPEHVVNQIWDYVDQFICPINYIPRGDLRIPPGDHHGTGWFIEKNSIPHLCTCEHVAKYEAYGTLGYAPYGGSFGVNVGSKFSLNKHPIDFAMADISSTWAHICHRGKLIPKEKFAAVHQPAEGELLYFQGFPGADTNSAFGQHNVKALSAFLYEVVPPEELYNETPLFEDKLHICMAWSPANATPLTPHANVLSTPPGMSGSILWDTGYIKAKNEDRDWSINDIKVTGIVWGASSKACVITATRIENFYHLLT